MKKSVSLCLNLYFPNRLPGHKILSFGGKDILLHLAVSEFDVQI